MVSISNPGYFRICLLCFKDEGTISEWREIPIYTNKYTPHPSKIL